ncbi:uncharacterized protein TNCV_2351991 [Trichonephila clavipes]|nr:uncharacterized protein TNCV_2351991 [Trichonephila clavipes]
MLTLKEISLVKSATGFINDSDIRRIINDFEEEVWKKAVREQMSGLGIPLILQEEIITLIKPIKLDVDNWIRDHNGIFTTEQECYLEFYFNGDGTVNPIKTADSLIHSKWLNGPTRFELACQYWSCWDVLTFFKNLPEVERNYILHYSKGNKKLNKHEEKVEQWIKYYKGGCISESQPWGCCFHYNWYDVSLHNRLMGHLSEEDYNNRIAEAFERTKTIDLGHYHLSKMNADYREQLLTRFPGKVLSVYLFWPCNNYFLDAANKVWDRLPENHFICLLHILIYHKIVALWNDFDYVDLLRQFWQRSPDHLKKCVEGTDIFKILMQIVEHGWQRVQYEYPRSPYSHIPTYEYTLFLRADATILMMWRQ